MMSPTHDTSWTISAKGNLWRRLDGKILVVGESKDGEYYWAMRDGDLRQWLQDPNQFKSISQKHISNRGAS